jgi:hypothetical protein
LSERGDDEQVAAGQAMQLQSIGLTLLGVILSVAVTVGFSLPGAWWVGLLGGIGTVVVLILVVRLGSTPGRGPLARLAAWMTRRSV